MSLVFLTASASVPVVKVGNADFEQKSSTEKDGKKLPSYLGSCNINSMDSGRNPV